jgi:glutamate 5-kinase
VAENFNAELLVILSDIDALYDKDPHKFDDAVVRKEVSALTAEELNAPTTANNEFATGGIVTKLKAADFLLNHGKEMFLATGFGLEDVRSFLLDGIQIGGTLFRRV